MRKGLLSSVATALVGAGSALAQNPYYLPTDGQSAGAPALLSADPTQAPASAPVAPPALTGGSTGLVPGVDCLPNTVPSHPRFFGDVSYMLMWVKNGPNPGPLAMLSPAGAPLFGPGSTAIIGGQESKFDGQSGVRANIGAWLGCDGKIGVEAAGFVVQQASNARAFTNDGTPGNPTLSRPFANFDLVPPGLDALIVDGVRERETTRLWGYEVNGLLNWRDDCNRRTDLIAGFTYTDLRETLGVTSTTNIPIGAGFPIVASFDDAINTRNQFYAGQIGARTTWTSGPLSLVMSGKIAVGVNHESVDRFGSSSATFGTATPVTAPTGFLVQTSNAGNVTRDKFTVGLPSQIILGYQVTEHLNAYVGWDFIYLSAAARPGKEVDLTSQTDPTTGAAIRPVGGIKQTDFWANSLLAGLAFKY